jgi:lipoprotein-releasing system permease protein
MHFLFAWRYFKGKKSTQAIHIISWVSILAMSVGTAALIIVLSVFNGFESFIQDLYSNYYPPIKISAIVGKTFQADSIMLHSISNIDHVQRISVCLEEKVMLAFEDHQIVATLKGIDENYDSITHIRTKLSGGDLNLSMNEEIPSLTIGSGLANRLGANEETHIPLKAYSFKQHESGTFINPSEAYNSQLFAVSGVYELQEEIDNKVAFGALEMVQLLTDKPNMISSIEIDVNSVNNWHEVKSKIQKIVPLKSLQIETRFEQNRTLNFVLSTERTFVFAFLSFILIIASFNIIGALSMLVIDKEKDIRILRAMGIHATSIRNIFMSTGILLALIGATVGCLFAFMVCLIQQKFGIVKLGGSGSFLVEAYPVQMQIGDFAIVYLLVFIIAIFASYFPAIKAGKKFSGMMMK